MAHVELLRGRGSTALLAVCVLVLLCLSGTPSAALTANSLSADAQRLMAEECARQSHPNQCLGTPGCRWCCDEARGSPCFLPSREDALRFAARGALVTCPANAILQNRNATCAQLCHSDSHVCEDCESKRWCNFCRSSSQCQAPSEACEGGSIVQQCTLPADSDSGTASNSERVCFTVMFITGASALLTSIVVIAIVAAYHSVKERRRARILQEAREQRRQLRHRQQQQQAAALEEIVEDESNERQQLLQPDPEPVAPASAAMPSCPSAVLDDDSVCYLCLDARPSVAFLPCYHTCCCEVCSNRLRPVANEVDCPFCRQKIEAMVSLSKLLQPPQQQQ